MTTPNPESTHGSDVCECGNYRSQHRPKCMCGCPAFRFFCVTTDRTHWNKYHGEPEPEQDGETMFQTDKAHAIPEFLVPQSSAPADPPSGVGAPITVADVAIHVAENFVGAPARVMRICPCRHPIFEHGPQGCIDAYCHCALTYCAPPAPVEDQPSDNHFLYASKYAGITFDQAAAVACALTHKGWRVPAAQVEDQGGQEYTEGWRTWFTPLRRKVHEVAMRPAGISMGEVEKWTSMAWNAASLAPVETDGWIDTNERMPDEPDVKFWCWIVPAESYWFDVPGYEHQTVKGTWEPHFGVLSTYRRRDGTIHFNGGGGEHVAYYQPLPAAPLSPEEKRS
jgi:hypothetical protein